MRKSIKNILIATLCGAFVPFGMAEEAAVTEPAPAIADEDLPSRLGYYYGYSFGQMLKDSGSADVDTNVLLQGLRDSLADSPPLLGREEVQYIYQIIQERQNLAQAEKQQAQQAQQQARQEQSKSNLQLAEAFLAGNAEREEVTLTESGLQYEIVHDEEGPTPSATDRVTVHYKGTFTDGNQFDASGEKPVSFPLQQVISGWTEGLQLMSVGDKFRFYLHPDLAYGEAGAGRIPPNSALIFDVELVKIN